MSTHSPPARLLLRRHITELGNERAAMEELRTRLEAEHRAAGAAVIRAQERERQRLAQDLHDEVNQALTAILLRLEAALHEAPPALPRSCATPSGSPTQAMEELLRLARKLRPAVLDDHGLMPALHTQVRDFTEQTGIRATFHPRHAAAPVLRAAARDLPRHAGGPLEHRPARLARACDVELSFVGRTVLRISDDGRGFTRAARRAARARRDARARDARRRTSVHLVRATGSGTRVELTI